MMKHRGLLACSLISIAALAVACGTGAASQATRTGQRTPVPAVTGTATLPPSATPAAPLTSTTAPTASATPVPVRPTDTPERVAPTDTPVPFGPPTVGEHHYGGEVVTLGRLTLQLPVDGEFIIWGGISDPGGGFVGVYHVATRSRLFLQPDTGRELERDVIDPAANAVFDAVIAGERFIPALLPHDQNRPAALAVAPTAIDMLEGGRAYRWGSFTFVIPVGYHFKWAVSLNDPGGARAFIILNEAGDASVLLNEDGTENHQSPSVGPLTAAFDQIVASVIRDVP